MILSMLILHYYYFASVLNRSQMSFCGYIFLFKNAKYFRMHFLAYDIIKQGYIFLFENGKQNVLVCVFSLMTSSTRITEVTIQNP